MTQVHVNKDSVWEYVKPAPLNRKILLLSKDNICTVGVWRGEALPDNKTYKAWQGLPDRDQALERQIGYAP